MQCSEQLAAISPDVNIECCPGHTGRAGCDGDLPSTCSEECAAVWMPFAKACSEWLLEQGGALVQVTAVCESEEYGRYHAGSNHGRCSDGDLAEYQRQSNAACCGQEGVMCEGFAGGADKPTQADPLPGIAVPIKNGQAYCSKDCGRFFEEFYADCHPAFEAAGAADKMHAFLAVCQGMERHRRLERAPDQGAAAGGGKKLFVEADADKAAAQQMYTL